MNTAARHHIDCEWHLDQYDWECTCGATRPRTSTPAQELRELARDIYGLTGKARIASIAWPAVNAICDYLTLRARVMELEGERDVVASAGRPAHLEETNAHDQSGQNRALAAESKPRSHRPGAKRPQPDAAARAGDPSPRRAARKPA